MHSPTMTAQEIAELLHMKQSTFGKKRVEMEAAGFPRRLPGTFLWSRRLVLAWIDGYAPLSPSADFDRDIDPVAAARADLEARIGQADRSAA